MDLGEYWNEVYDARGSEVSWFEASPVISLELVGRFSPSRRGCIDVGSGTSDLIRMLAEDGWEDLTALDVSPRALALLRSNLGSYADVVTLIVSDIRDFAPPRQYTVWHDRAVFHFLVDETDRHRYATRVASSLAPGGIAVIGGFSPGGPKQCSGLEVHRASSKDIGAAMGDAFEVIFEMTSTHETPQGIPQAFSWTVLVRRADDEIASVGL